MADLAKQKETPPAKSEELQKPETADEKRKRLRKEQRRSLRVSFKGDDELVSIRTFVHDPDEELGHEDSQVRDVGDSKGEGQMLKMHKDLELDDEDEYEPPEDIEIPPPWILPHRMFFLCSVRGFADTRKKPTSPSSRKQSLHGTTPAVAVRSKSSAQSETLKQNVRRVHSWPSTHRLLISRLRHGSR